MPKPDDPLQGLQQKIDTAKASIDNDNPDDSTQSMGRAMSLGVELVAGVLVGSLIGYGLDYWFHTMPLFLIICFFLGVAAGFRNLLREVSEEEEKASKK